MHRCTLYAIGTESNSWMLLKIDFFFLFSFFLLSWGIGIEIGVEIFIYLGG